MFRTICSSHDTIIINSNEILKLINLFNSKINPNKINFNLTIEEITALTNDIVECLIPQILLDVSEAKDAGQRMENKLRERKESIAKLVQLVEEQEDLIMNQTSALDFYRK